MRRLRRSWPLSRLNGVTPVEELAFESGADQRLLTPSGGLEDDACEAVVGQSANKWVDTAVVIGKGKRQLTLVDEHIEAVATDIDTDIDGGC